VRSRAEGFVGEEGQRLACLERNCILTVVPSVEIQGLGVEDARDDSFYDLSPSCLDVEACRGTRAGNDEGLEGRDESTVGCRWVEEVHRRT
jgi:hypothetical protein